LRAAKNNLLFLLIYFFAKFLLKQTKQKEYDMHV